MFAPLHDAYHKGSLRPGLVAIYKDGAGVAHQYRLLWVQHLPVATWGEGATWAATSSTGDHSRDLRRCVGRLQDRRPVRPGVKAAAGGGLVEIGDSNP